MKKHTSDVRNAPTADARNLLPVPVVAGLLPLPGGGWLLPAAGVGKPLPVLVPMWPDSAPTEERKETIQLNWGVESVVSRTFSAPFDPDNEIFRKLDVPYIHMFDEGTYELRYQLLITGEPSQSSEALTITIDATAPELNKDSALIFPEEVVRDGVTARYLTENSDQVVATVPPYTDPAPGDVITAYWDSTEGEAQLAVTRTLTAGDYQEPITLTFDGDMIRARGEGTRWVRYRITDMAGHQTDWADYVALKVLEDAPADGLAPPWFNAGDIADAEDNTLLRKVIDAGNGVPVWVPAWKNLVSIPGLEDVLYLEWGPGADPDEKDFEAVDLLTITGPADPDAFPLSLTVPAEKLRPDGIYSVRYRVHTWNDAKVPSPAITFIVDTIPPWAQKEPEAATGPGVPVTDAYLEEHPAGVVCTLPAYPDWQPGDTVVFWWLNALPDDPTTLEPAGVQAVTAQPQEITVPASVVRETGDGGCYLVYVLKDKAGNLSRVSVYTRVSVALGALPAQLFPPLVPRAGDGLVDLDDAHAGVHVGIQTFANWKPADRIIVTWGTTELPAEVMGSTPRFPVEVRVPTEVLRHEYGDATGPVTTRVSYRVVRGDMVFGPLEIVIAVDFSVIGPELPEWPDPTNPDLPVATVYGSDRSKPNQLTRDDQGKPAIVEFALYAPVAAGEQVEFYWNGKRVADASYTVQPGDAPGKTVVASIPWAVIAAAGNQPALPVHYRIHAPGSPNEQRSPTTLVDVKAIVITPPAPAFLKLSPSGFLNCQSLDGSDHAVLVQVPDLSTLLAAGDKVTLTWTPLPGLTGETELERAIKVETITLDATTVKGFVWRVQPYQDYILPTHDFDGASPIGRARAIYAFDHQSGSAVSETAEALIGMSSPEGDGKCDVS